MGDRELTRLLNAAGDGDEGDALARQLLGELRGMALRAVSREPAGATLSATELVSEVWLRVVREAPERGWDSRAHFFGSAARAMRRLLIDQSRRRRSRSELLGQRLDIDRVDVAVPSTDARLLALDESLDRLAERDADMVRIVELRFFAGQKMHEISDRLDMPLRTVEQRWARARAWLRADIGDDVLGDASAA